MGKTSATLRRRATRLASRRTSATRWSRSSTPSWGWSSRWKRRRSERRQSSSAGRSSIPRRRFRGRTSRPRGSRTSRAPRGTTGGTSADRDALAELLTHPRYEVFPVEGIADEVVAHVPTEIKVAVTSSPTRGIEATLRLCEELASAGFQVAPHLAARLVRDEEHLRDILQRLFALGIRDVFAIAGDADLPAGKFEGATELLAAMADLGHGMEQVGISGYP